MRASGASRPRHARWFLIPALGALGLAGCASFAPEPDRTRFYTLSPPSVQRAAAQPPANAPMVGVRVSNLADYLRRPGIATRASAYEIRYAEEDRWADQLDGAISRAVAEALAPRVADVAMVTTAPAVRAPIPPVVVDIEVLAFDARTGESPAALVTLEWRIFAGERSEPMATGRFRVEKTGWNAGDFEQFAALGSAALDDFAASLVETIKEAVALAMREGAPRAVPENVPGQRR